MQKGVSLFLSYTNMNKIYASILISVICMIENTDTIKKTPFKLVFMYSFNVVLGLLDELLELKEYIKHKSETSLGSYFHTNLLNLK